MKFADEIELTTAQAETIARGLYAIAACDGVHEREAALIASFFGDSGGGAVALAQLARAPAIRGDELAAGLASEPVRKVFLKTALLLAWADGVVSPKERAVVDGFSKALGFGAQDVESTEVEVKEFLLSHLTHLANTGAVVEVAKKMAI